MNDRFPELTASWQELEPFRLTRLARVTGYLAAIYPLALERIERMHDHKGELTVYWLNSPTLSDQAAIQLAWAHSDVGDTGGEIKHAVGEVGGEF